MVVSLPSQEAVSCHSLRLEKQLPHSDVIHRRKQSVVIYFGSKASVVLCCVI